MIQASDVKWSKAEKKVAQGAFDKAHERELNALMAEVRERGGAIAAPEDMWRLHDFLSAKRHDIDGKYDYRYSNLIFVFARLVREGWLQLDELDGLDADKRTKVGALARM
ncbi:hypothetical protein IQ241_03810 [Romeria aff. gracilis LEGE 07310]|uniref:Fluorescence recovery protein n=1 Tax=Vasconcelosia minhoensis LEGE 07310 TaxID=915328 RepID=A0A8J7A4Z0_9CYAN|nr:hypothetical protein [Romeria gracilis]MBE9076427.1 hypothetical protein [Romeria aff. gracilis LEGE 07310]